MKETTEFLYHILGICGEYTHPHLINMGFLLAAIYGTVKIYQKIKSYE
tara:strand:- start:2 stop:145 length:144 start_codon:yes stop_codon:yes gene_type:complete